MASTAGEAGSKGLEQRVPAKHSRLCNGATSEIRKTSLLENTPLSVTPRKVKGDTAEGEVGGTAEAAAAEGMAAAEEVEAAAVDAAGIEAAGGAANVSSTARISDVSGCWFLVPSTHDRCGRKLGGLDFYQFVQIHMANLGTLSRAKRYCKRFTIL